MNDLHRLFTKKNLVILKDLSSKNETYIREISENTGVSPAQVHQAIKIFKKLGFIKEKKLKNKKRRPRRLCRESDFRHTRGRLFRRHTLLRRRRLGPCFVLRRRHNKFRRV